MLGGAPCKERCHRDAHRHRLEGQRPQIFGFRTDRLNLIASTNRQKLCRLLGFNGDFRVLLPSSHGDSASNHQESGCTETKGYLFLENISSSEFELAVLIETQSQALAASPYLRMSCAAQLAYNERRKRITALRQSLGKKVSRLYPRSPTERAA